MVFIVDSTMDAPVRRSTRMVQLASAQSSLPVREDVLAAPMPTVTEPAVESSAKLPVQAPAKKQKKERKFVRRSTRKKKAKKARKPKSRSKKRSLNPRSNKIARAAVKKVAVLKRQVSSLKGARKVDARRARTAFAKSTAKLRNANKKAGAKWSRQLRDERKRSASLRKALAVARNAVKTKDRELIRASRKRKAAKKVAKKRVVYKLTMFSDGTFAKAAIKNKTKKPTKKSRKVRTNKKAKRARSTRKTKARRTKKVRIELPTATTEDVPEPTDDLTESGVAVASTVVNQ